MGLFTIGLNSLSRGIEMRPSEFLRTLWGDKPPGLVQVWRLANRRSTYISDLALADKAEGKADLYTGVGLARRDYGPTHRAPAAEVQALAGLWLDLDLKDDEKSSGAPNEEAALAVADTFLTPTIIVHSGHGLHVWWLFEEALELDSASLRKKLATMSIQWHRLHEKEADFSIDSAQDLARLLRLPGTLNAKREPHVEVRVLANEGNRYSLAELSEIAAKAGTVSLPTAPPASAASLPIDEPELAKLMQDRGFAKTWRHEREPHWSLSEYDLALCSTAAGKGWSEAQLGSLIGHHRSAYGDESKGLRPDYVQRTIARAMKTVEKPSTNGATVVEPSQSLSAEEWADVIAAALQDDTKPAVRMPFRQLNEALDGGLRPGEVCMVAGYTSHGKSLFVDMIADRAAADGRRIHLYLTEMSAAERGLRLLARKTPIEFRRLRRRELKGEDWSHVMRELNGLAYGVSIVSNWSVEDVVKHIAKHRWDMAIVDLVHGFHYTDERDLSKSSGALLRAAKSWQPGTVVVAAAHLNDGQMRDARSPMRPRPGLHSIKGSSSLKQDPDVVMFVWRKDNEDGVPGDNGEIWIAKNRQGAFAGVGVRLDAANMCFRELDWKVA